MASTGWPFSSSSSSVLIARDTVAPLASLPLACIASMQIALCHHLLACRCAAWCASWACDGGRCLKSKKSKADGEDDVTSCGAEVPPEIQDATALSRSQLWASSTALAESMLYVGNISRKRHKASLCASSSARTPSNAGSIASSKAAGDFDEDAMSESGVRRCLGYLLSSMTSPNYSGWARQVECFARQDNAAGTGRFITRTCRFDAQSAVTRSEGCSVCFSFLFLRASSSLMTSATTTLPHNATATSTVIASSLAASTLGLRSIGGISLLPSGKTSVVLRNLANDDESMAAFAKELSVDATIQRLDLCDNALGEVGAMHIASVLGKNTSVRYLELFNTAIGDAGASALASALEKNTTVETLNVGGNQISDAGAATLAAMLRNNKTIHTIWINNNKIGDAGAAALAGALMKNSTLLELHIHSNQVGDVGAKILADALNKNSTLQILFLLCNPVSPKGEAFLDSIDRRLERNKELKGSENAPATARGSESSRRRASMESMLDETSRLAECRSASFPRRLTLADVPEEGAADSFPRMKARFSR